MGADVSVYRQCYIVPAHISAALTVRTVVELDIEQGVGLQALLRGNGLAVAKTEETGLREMEKSKTNTEMYPG